MGPATQRLVRSPHSVSCSASRRVRKHHSPSLPRVSLSSGGLRGNLFAKNCAYKFLCRLCSRERQLCGRRPCESTSIVRVLPASSSFHSRARSFLEILPGIRDRLFKALITVSSRSAASSLSHFTARTKRSSRLFARFCLRKSHGSMQLSRAKRSESRPAQEPKTVSLSFSFRFTSSCWTLGVLGVCWTAYSYIGRTNALNKRLHWAMGKPP